MLRMIRCCIAVATALASLAASPNARASQSRSYVVSWFFVATYLQDDDCPDGTNPMARELYTRILKDLNYTPSEVKHMLGGIANDSAAKDSRGRTLRQIGTMRGRIDGQCLGLRHQQPTPSAARVHERKPHLHPHRRR